MRFLDADAVAVGPGAVRAGLRSPDPVAEMEPAGARRSYLVCSVQRAGSWLLCHALEDTGVLGRPAEYFHRGDEPFWRGRWGAASEDGFLRAVQREPVTPNGVWGSKMMWNYLADAVARLRSWPAAHLAEPACAWHQP